MAKQNTAPVVKKANLREVKRAQEKDDLETLEEKASHPVSLENTFLFYGVDLNRWEFFFYITIRKTIIAVNSLSIYHFQKRLKKVLHNVISNK